MVASNQITIQNTAVWFDTTITCSLYFLYFEDSSCRNLVNFVMLKLSFNVWAWFEHMRFPIYQILINWAGVSSSWLIVVLTPHLLFIWWSMPNNERHFRGCLCWTCLSTYLLFVQIRTYFCEKGHFFSFLIRYKTLL